MEFKGGSDITKGGDISVIDFPAGFRRACGPPARVQGSLVYRDGEPIGETDRRYNHNHLFSIPEIHQSGYRTFQYITTDTVQNESLQYNTYNNNNNL